MSLPRRIVPGATYLLTRRIFQRRFLLRPTPEVVAIFNYCLAEAAARFNIRLIAWCAMSNHYHAVIHDPDGNVPRFTEHFHKMTSKTLNAYYGRWENLWSTEETCVTRLVTPDDVFDKVAYVLSNPVTAHLVAAIEEWPGASSWELMGKNSGLVVARPQYYFRKGTKSRMPATATLLAVAPEGLDEVAYARWVDRVREEVQRRAALSQKIRRQEGIPLVGRDRVLHVDPNEGPSSDATHRKLRPALACKDEVRMEAEKEILKEFRRAYYTARVRFASGVRDAVFPAGTYRLLRTWSVCCTPFPNTA